MIIVLDTNFLIYMIKHRIADQIKEFRAKLVITSTVKKELQKPTLKVKEKAYAAAALELIDIWKVQVIESKIKDVDKSIIDTAKNLKEKDNNIYVATADKKLVDKLTLLRIKNIAIKRGSLITAD